MENQIKQLAKMIKESSNIVFFGGAGVSTESGLKDYRSADGIYNTEKEYGVSPETILSRTFFMQNTKTFYDFYRKYFVAKVEPNYAHKALADLESMGKLKYIITQNIDGLHQLAGSRNVIELHGNANEFECFSCRMKPQTTEIIKKIECGEVPTCNQCHSVLKPKVVLYEEPLYAGVPEKAIDVISQADMLIIGGTSLAVYPAASFVQYFRGRYIVIINKGDTEYNRNADLVIRDSIGKVFTEVMKEIRA